jgi:2-aminoadipate transaminase
VDIDDLLRSAASDNRVLCLAGGLPAPQTFPRQALTDAADHTMSAMDTAPLQYGWPEGRAGLRRQIAERLRKSGADVQADEVIITNGAQDALALAVDVLAPKSVQVDACTYPGALAIFRARGCRVDTGAAAVRYAMPAVANPTGLAATPAERQEIFGAAYVIEDDAYAPLNFYGPPAPPLLATARDRVFHIGTFSKILSPGLRVGWLVPPRSWLTRIREAKQRRDLHAGGLTQAIVERIFVTIDFEERLTRLRALYARRAATMLRALRRVPRVRYQTPVGGFSIWVQTDLVGPAEDLLARAIQAGVAFDPGVLFRAEPGLAPLAMRLSFSALPEERIDDAIDRFADVLDRARRRYRTATAA